MKKNIIGIFICTLLIVAAVLPLTGTIESSNIRKVNLERDLLLQPPEAWNKTFGGITSDIGYSVRQTTDGGFIVVGGTNTPMGDVYLIKTDAHGNKQWDNTFAGGVGYCVQQTTDGGYIIAGKTAGVGDALLIKTDANGVEQWNNTFGAGKYDSGYSVQQTTDGGYIVAGAYTYMGPPGTYDAWLIKTNSSGIMQWDKKFGGSYSDHAYSVQQTTDGGYIVAGSTDPTNSNVEVYLIKTDSSGVATWTKSFGGTNTDIGQSVQQTTDGGYTVTGWTDSIGAGLTDVYLIKTDSSGVATWTKTFGGTNYDDGRSVWQTSEGGYIVAGSTLSFGAGFSDVYLIKTDATGNEQWNETFGGGQNDYGYCAQETADGGYIIAGDTSSYGAGSSDVWLIKIGGGGPTLKLTFLLGAIANLNTGGTQSTFDSVALLYIQLNPFKFGIYTSGETITVSNQYLGILTQSFAIGFFNAAI
ncbi:MAG: hypothetical protein ACOC80_03690 [Petrotogales bacterium]